MPGEVAEMMLDGTLCECCGEYIDDDEAGGYPRYCSEQCEKARSAAPAPAAKGSQHVWDGKGQPLAKKALGWLQRLSVSGLDDGPMTPAKGERMYAGVPWETAPTQFQKLRKRGYVECRAPHNPAHKDRAVITAAGMDFLKQQS